MSGQDHVKFTDAHAGMRLDKALSEVLELSRSRIQALIADGQVRLNGLPCTDASRKVARGHFVDYTLPEPEAAEPEPEDIPLDIIYEDGDLLVINKQVGLVVHPGAGNWSGTLVNALLYHCGDSLSGIGGVMRPGIVHRLDKDTSGLMVVAKNDVAHTGLSAQLEARDLKRIYHALALGVSDFPKFVVNQPIGRDSKNRLKMAVRGQNGKRAVTHVKLLKNYLGALGLYECALDTGRTHQIRVHMRHEGYPLVGDALYGAQVTKTRAMMKKADYEADIIEKVIEFPRQALHAKQLSFAHPVKGKEMTFEAGMPEDLSKLLKSL